MTTRHDRLNVLGWLAIGLGVAIAIWSGLNAIGRPRFHELDLLDLLMGLVIAGTFVAVGLRLRARKSPWRPLLVGLGVCFILFVLALFLAIQDFNG